MNELIVAMFYWASGVGNGRARAGSCAESSHINLSLARKAPFKAVVRTIGATGMFVNKVCR